MSPDEMRQDEIRQKVTEAREIYQRANDEYRRLVNISRDVTDPAHPASADGTLALRQALEIHRRARVQYEKALHAFTDSISAQYRRIHLKTNQGRRVTLCGIWAPHNFILLNDLTEDATSICQTCLQIARSNDGCTSK